MGEQAMTYPCWTCGRRCARARAAVDCWRSHRQTGTQGILDCARTANGLWLRAEIRLAKALLRDVARRCIGPLGRP